MKKLAFALAALAAGIFVAPGASADILPTPYVQASGGYTLGNIRDHSGDLASGNGFGNDFGNSVAFGGGVGAALPVGFGPVSLRADLTGSWSTDLGGGTHSGTLTDGGTVSANVKLRNETYLVNLYADLDIGAPIVPFIGFGVGTAHNQVKALTFSNAGGSFAVINGNSHSGAAWSATAGAGYRYTDHITVEFAYRYIDAGKVESGNIFTDITQSPGVSQMLSQPIISTMDLHQFNLTLRYSF